MTQFDYGKILESEHHFWIKTAPRGEELRGARLIWVCLLRDMPLSGSGEPLGSFRWPESIK